MANDYRWIIHLANQSWQLTRVRSTATGPADAQTSSMRAYVGSDISDEAAGICEQFDEWKYAGEPILVSLGTTWCLSAQVSVPNSRMGRNRPAMGYLMEPYLPWAAEDAIIDYELKSSQAFMVAIEAGPISELIEQLDQHGLQIESVAPAARLCLSQQLASQPKLLGRSLLLWQYQGSIEAWIVENNYPQCWQWFPEDASVIVQALRQQLLIESQVLTVISDGLPDDIEHELSALDGVTWQDVSTSSTLSMAEKEIAEAVNILDGRKQAPIELRRDTLSSGDPLRHIRGSIRVLQLSSLLILVAIGFALWTKANAYEDQRTLAVRQQERAFTRIFKNQTIPVGIHQRLKSEQSRLQKERGQGAKLPEHKSSTETLLRFLNAVPDDLRFLVTQLDIENGELSLSGEVKDFRSTEQLVNGLRAFSMDVESPKNNRIDAQRVRFGMTAKPYEATDERQLEMTGK